jgi:lysophospholipase L1-like esterase
VRAKILAVLILAVASVLLTPVEPAEAAQLSWVAIGDSYSAGVGGSTTGEGLCKREPTIAYSAQARRMLEAEGHTFDYVLAACIGAVTRDIKLGQRATVGGADIVTMTIGGNDAGFASYIAGCIASPLTECESTDSLDWDSIYNTISDTYVGVRKAMKPNAHLFVSTYPVFFANIATWADHSCPGDLSFSHRFAQRLNEASVRMGDTIYWAVQEANRKLESTGKPGNIHFVDSRPPVRTETFDGRVRRVAYDSAGICSGVEEFIQSMNGAFSGLGNDLTDSFHPTNIGHFNMAVPVAQAIRSSLSGTSSPPTPGPATIRLNRGAPARAGYWYSVTLNGFPPGTRVGVRCHDSMDPDGFIDRSVKVAADGVGTETQLCYSGDGPDHWVTALGTESNHVGWGTGLPTSGDGSFTGTTQWQYAEADCSFVHQVYSARYTNLPAPLGSGSLSLDTCVALPTGGSTAFPINGTFTLAADSGLTLSGSVTGSFTGNPYLIQLNPTGVSDTWGLVVTWHGGGVPGQLEDVDGTITL